MHGWRACGGVSLPSHSTLWSGNPGCCAPSSSLPPSSSIRADAREPRYDRLQPVVIAPGDVVNRVATDARRHTARAGLVVGVIAATVLGFAAPAWAHHPVLFGSTSCSGSNHVVHWTIGNSESDHQITAVSLASAIGTESFPVSGYTLPIGNGGSTIATTIVPAPTLGTITLTVVATWADGHSATDQTSVDLVSGCTTTTSSTTTTTSPCSEMTTTTAPCIATTTTTGSGPTTTTAAPTTTAVSDQSSTTTETPTTAEAPTTSVDVEGSTTTLGGQGGTVPTTEVEQPTTTSPVGELGGPVPTTSSPLTGRELPRTGGGTSFPFAFGLSCLGAGALLAVRRRRSRTCL